MNAAREALDGPSVLVTTDDVVGLMRQAASTLLEAAAELQHEANWLARNYGTDIPTPAPTFEQVGGEDRMHAYLLASIASRAGEVTRASKAAVNCLMTAEAETRRRHGDA